jgi:hypothetical protein
MAQSHRRDDDVNSMRSVDLRRFRQESRTLHAVDTRHCEQETAVDISVGQAA